MAHHRTYSFSGFFGALAIAGLALLTSHPVTSSGQGQTNPDEYQISVNVGMVMLPVVVTDRRGQEVTGLGESEFHVYEDGRPQQISFFEPEDVPVKVGLIIDNSGSMGSKRPEITAAAGEFAKTSNPDDRMFVVNFNQRVSMGLPKGMDFTGDLQTLLDAVARNPAAGNTALYDAVVAGLDHVKSDKATRKALILITDGEDNASHTSLSALLKRAAESNTEIYSLGVFDESFSGSHTGIALKRLSKTTGGRAYFPQSPSEIVGICKQIAQDLRHQYTIGYVPNNPSGAGKYHAIRVTAGNTGKSDLRVSTRSGYSMPTEPQSSALPSSTKASL